MESKVQKAKKNTDIAEENDGVKAEKIKSGYCCSGSSKSLSLVMSHI